MGDEFSSVTTPAFLCSDIRSRQGFANKGAGYSHREKQGMVYLVLGVLALASVLTIVIKGLPSLKRVERWSIGIYMGDSPTSIANPTLLRNPIITYKSITDVVARSVADPFMIYDDDTWYMFFEIKTEKTRLGQIGLAVSDDGLRWTYRETILKEDFHLSYPYVFKWENEYYMVPETVQNHSVRLYKASRFPYQWHFQVNLLSDVDLLDSSILNYGGMWWLFTSSPASDVLHLYRSENLVGPWVEHPSSPIVKGDPHRARPAGRVLVLDDSIIRFAQDDSTTYGRSVYAYEIVELTPATYNEREIKRSPIISATNVGWNSLGMHHMDPHPLGLERWIACVDGKSKQFFFRFKPIFAAR
jgi:hypothetical protein